ncbi:MAG: ATP-dependent 6-phosphofructokinase [Ignavibacteria bacterium]|nr:ATP-dependent 6-phosphofructokinase [Ignavibacteria bacterium]
MRANMKVKRIGILTGGGDCPGLNAVIRGVTKPAHEMGMTVFGIEDGFEGLVEGKMHELTNKEVSGIINLGGTILGSSNKGDPFHWPVDKGDEVVIEDHSKLALKNYKGWGLDCLIAIGGDGTMHISEKLSKLGMKVIGVPKTIDNDLEGTDLTFGYDSAVFAATEAIDRLHTTASSHHRVMVIELMGRYAGWIALGAGVAGGADVILIPEIPFKWEDVYKKVIERSTRGKRFSIICVAEGSKPFRGKIVVKAQDKKRTDPIQLGGIGNLVGRNIQENTGLETRITVLGHLQRGGSPTPFDRILATRFGTYAIEIAAKKKFGYMVALKGNEIKAVRIGDAIKMQRLVPPDCQMIRSAVKVGISFGNDSIIEWK